MRNNIKNILREKNVSIRQLAIGTNRNYANVHELVNREDLGTTQLGTLIEVARFLGVDIAELYKQD